MKTPSSTIAERFIAYLKEEGQYEALPEIAQILQREAERQAEIAIISAEPLEAHEKKELEEMLTAKWGEHIFLYSVDAILLSGLVIQFKDSIIDLTGKYQLSKLAEALQ